MVSKWATFTLLTTVVGLTALTGAQQSAQIVVSETATDAASILNYWTQERMDSAIPMDLPIASGNEPSDDFPSGGDFEPLQIVPSVAPGGSNGTARSYDAGAEPWLPPGYNYPFPFSRYDVAPLLYANLPLARAGNLNPTFPYTTVGKVFFRLNGENYVCSASVVYDHTLLTARHCLYDFNTKTFATTFMFSPGYYFGDNRRLGGRWGGKKLLTWAAPAPNWRYDIGFVQLFDDDGAGCGGSLGGKPIETYTGELGSAWGGNFAQVHWNEFGYPAAAPFTGKVMVQADSSTAQVGGGGSWQGTLQAGNDMTGGSSGGPWILSFFPNQSGAVNFANGLNSFEPAGRPLATGSPTFRNFNYGRLYNAAKALACP